MTRPDHADQIERWESQRDLARTLPYCHAILAAIAIGVYDPPSSYYPEGQGHIDSNFVWGGVVIMALSCIVFWTTTEGGKLIGRLLALPGLWTLIAIMALINDQYRFGERGWFVTLFASFLGAAFAGIYLRSALHPRPAEPPGAPKRAP